MQTVQEAEGDCYFVINGGDSILLISISKKVIFCICVGQILNACIFLSQKFWINVCCYNPERKRLRFLFVLNYIDNVDVSMWSSI